MIPFLSNNLFHPIRRRYSHCLMSACLFLACGAPLHAQSLTEIWKAMPDSILPYLDHNQRVDMSSYTSMHVDGTIDNQLGGKSRMDALTTDFTEIKLNEATTLQLKLLPTERRDTVVCLLKTWTSGDTGESQILFFTPQWQPLPVQRFLGVSSLQELADRLTSRPDHLSTAEYGKLKSMIDPVMVKASLSAEDHNLALQLSLPLLSKEDKDKVAAILVPLRLKWSNGKYVNQ